MRSLIEFPRSMVSCFVEKLRLPLAGQEEIEQKNQKREEKKRGGGRKFKRLGTGIREVYLKINWMRQ